MYVPDNWYHSTLNIGETVFMANFLNRPMLEFNED